MRRMNRWPKPAEVRAFYGDPDPDHNGVADRMWEMNSLERISPPYRMVLAWDTARRLNSITVHKKCASSLFRILEAIAKHYGSEQGIEANRMHMFGGTYAFRLTRGGVSLSMHSYACAIDLDPASNGLGRAWKESQGMMPEAVIDIFKGEGWAWGGDFKRPDAMHFEAITR